MRRTLASLIPNCRRHGAGTPVSNMRRLLVRSHAHHAPDQIHVDGGLSAGANYDALH
jgi:hypothetical protein